MTSPGMMLKWNYIIFLNRFLFNIIFIHDPHIYTIFSFYAFCKKEIFPSIREWKVQVSFIFAINFLTQQDTKYILVKWIGMERFNKVIYYFATVGIRWMNIAFSFWILIMALWIFSCKRITNLFSSIFRFVFFF